MHKVLTFACALLVLALTGSVRANTQGDLVRLGIWADGTGSIELLNDGGVKASPDSTKVLQHNVGLVTLTNASVSTVTVPGWSSSDAVLLTPFNTVLDDGVTTYCATATSTTGQFVLQTNAATTGTFSYSAYQF